MDNATVVDAHGKSSAELEAEKLFPYPKNACKWVKIKIDWKRERWIKENRLQN